MKVYPLVLILIILLTTSCSYMKNVKLLIGGKIKRENYVQTIPFEWRKDLIVVKAKINADTTLREFIFDTGAFNSKIEYNLANELGLKVITEKKNSTAQGISQTIEVVRIDSIILGETTIYSLGAGKLRYGERSASQCIAASGIIGANLIKLAHWKIDYGQKLIYFSDQPFEVTETSYVLPFDRPLLSGTPNIEVNISGKTVENVLFDVGYNGGLILPAYLANHFDKNNSTKIIDQSTSGIYGTNLDTVTVSQLDVQIGAAKSTIPVEFSSLNKALLGNEYLHHFTVVINYKKKEIYLEQLKEVNIHYPGTFLVAEENDSLWIVNRTTIDSPLKIGEKLISVNGYKPGELYASYCDYVMNIGSLINSSTIDVIKMDSTLQTVRIRSLE